MRTALRKTKKHVCILNFQDLWQKIMPLNLLVKYVHADMKIILKLFTDKKNL